ncbi:MAG: DNA topoisomerase IV subunit A, partial [Lactococcus sp.]|nr:DNA topoisomerase IV subunit A [Lactococcus sp.]
LLKYTDLQVNYNFNMVAIDHATPQQVGIIPILSSYIQHKREIIRSRSIFDREKAEKRLHIVEGLIRVLSILDEVIALIRASDNKADARENLMASYDFSEAQAEAIVTLQLYRLTNTDVVTLQSEEAELKERILTLSAIINDEKTMFNVMKRELREVKKKFDQPRKSVLVDEVVTIEVEAASLIVKEETIVSVTRSGYVKRTTPRSFGASKLTEIGKREDDILLFHQPALTTQHLLMFTTLGNVIYRPIHELDDVKWKDIGTHCSSLVNNFSQDEAILFAYILDDFETVTSQLLITTKFGLIKQVQLSDFKPWRTYRSKSLQFAKFKQADDVVIGLEFAQNLDIMLVTYNGYALRFPSTDVPLVGPKAAGVKAMNLKDADFIVASYFVSTDSFYVLTQRGALKRVKFSDLPAKSRAGRGLQILRELKKAPHKVISSGTIKNRYGGDLFAEADQEMQVLQVISNTDTLFEINLPDLNILERTSNGSFIFDETKELGVKSAKIK